MLVGERSVFECFYLFGNIAEANVLFEDLGEVRQSGLSAALRLTNHAHFIQSLFALNARTGCCQGLFELAKGEIRQVSLLECASELEHRIGLSARVFYGLL